MKIIAATDFSPASQSAVRTAARLARKLGDTIAIVKVIEPPAVLYPELAAVSLEIVTNALRDAAVTQMKEARAQVADEGVTVEDQIVAGVPERVVPARAQEEGARLIVMGTHGRHGAARLLVGSVAERTVLAAPCPVLIVREDADPFTEWMNGKRPLRVVVGVDASPASQAALDWVRSLRAAGPCDIVLVHDYWPPREYARLGLRGPRDLFANDPEVAQVLERELRSFVGSLPGDGAVVWRVRAAWGRPGEALAEEAEAASADLLVVGTRQPHGWDRLRGGSAALSTVRASRVPVLCVPERARRPAAEQIAVPVLRSVLVTTDLSELGNAAVAHAYSLLRGSSGGTVELVHVREHALPSPIHAYAPDFQPLSPDDREMIEGRMRELIPAESERLGITTRITLIDGGVPAEAIVQAANRLGVDAICIASHGRSGLSRVLLGSVATRVVQQASRPVYVVRPRTG